MGTQESGLSACLEGLFSSVPYVIMKGRVNSENYLPSAGCIKDILKTMHKAPGYSQKTTTVCK